MAAIESDSKISLHVRSNSFPSAPHPLVSQFEEHLKRLKSSESATSSSSLSHKLSGLQDLHECTDKLLQSSITKQVLAREFSQKWVDELLDRSLRLLDIFSTAKDFLLQAKECIYEVQSAIRRRRGDETAFTVEGGKYLASRKNMKKAIQKVYGNVKEIRNEFKVSSPNNKIDVFSLLKEAEEVTMSTLESFLYFISEPKGQMKQTRWSSLMQPKRVTCESQESEANEFDKVDTALKSLNKHKPTCTNNFQGHLENLEMCIMDLEVGVERLSRQLIKTRASLLNIFNH